ncbi:Asd/ArgC dimerization domain-containing protein, partial [Streptococcus pneumoniae]|uniref:Asd/ArgC dimerization domain-containing protein n=1 Tax=Streptococcus pneumoniae TaxID=1313 RepID=UPI000A5655BC
STLPIDKIRYLASARSAGKSLKFKDQDITIEETTETAFEGVDIALFSAGGSTSAKYAPYAVKAGVVVVDNTSYFRQNGVKPRDLHAEILPSGGDKKHYPIAFNALPQIDVFTDNDYTYEEMKMTKETKKIMEDDSIAVS